MGSICCCCCGGSDDKKADKHKSNFDKKDINVKSERLFKAETEGTDEDNGQLALEEKLKAELIEKQKKTLFKPNNDSSYASSKRKRPGIEEKDSKELEALKKFVEKRVKEGQPSYQILNNIGSGNYAEVFKAYGTKERKFVAIKVIDLTKAEDNYRQNFLPKEVRILKKCKHQNIIKMYEIAQSLKRVFMIMEFAPNGTLSDWLKHNGPFNEVMARLTFTEVLQAISFMHSKRIAHRDLKLENILLCKDYKPKISDFSYAIELKDKNEKSEQFCGSLPYFPPEILQRQPHNPMVADIWSLGVCFYIMLNDGLPFRLGNDRLMLEKQLNKEWKFRTKVEPKLSTNLKSIVKIMLEPDVQQRVTSAQLMSDPWFKK